MPTVRDLLDRYARLVRLQHFLVNDWQIHDCAGQLIPLDDDGHVAGMLHQLVDAEIDRIAEEIERRTARTGNN